MRGLVSLVLSVAVVACSAGSGGNAALDGGADGGGDSTISPGATIGAGGGGGAPHSPSTGCLRDFVACGVVCADLETDPRHCGACGTKCGYVDGGLTACVDGECVPAPPGSCTKLTCGGACVSAWSIDHCGSCFNGCVDTALCLKDTCIDAKGDGATCKSGLSISDDEPMEFRYPQGLTGQHVFRCGGTTPVETRWFRWTASRTQKVTFEVQCADATDDYILEIFRAPSCDDAAFVGCFDEARPKLNVEVEAGITYAVAIGRESAGSGKLPCLRVDD